jgi:hypothetical protein
MHVRVIRGLHEALNDLAAFLQCMVLLLNLDLHSPPAAGEGGQLPEDLLDLYMYYAVTGLGQQSASLRAAALAMLAAVGQQSHLLVVPLLGRLEALQDDPW